MIKFSKTGVFIELCIRDRAAGVPIISSMGAGNKLDPAAFRVADLYETSVCPLARVMRRELRRRGIAHMKVVYSTAVSYTHLDVYKRQVHCSLLAEEAIHAALWDYAEKNGIVIEGLKKPKSEIHEGEDEEEDY